MAVPSSPGLMWTAGPCLPAVTAELFSRLDLFAHVPAELRAKVAPTLRCLFLNDGELICEQGDVADSLLVILNGEVSVSSRKTPLVTRKRFEIVGEQALTEGGQRGATLHAKGMLQLVLLPQSSFDLLCTNAAFAMNLARILSAKLNAATVDRAHRYRVEHLLFTEFRAHAAPAVLQELLASGEDYGRPREIDGVVLMVDIRGFSSAAMEIGPERLASDLGVYLAHSVDVIHRHGGLVDKFIGDAVLAVWGWPHGSRVESVASAFSCACELIASAGQFSVGPRPVAVGTGIGAGKMFIGNIGSDQKRQFTVLGPPVNAASRYQALCKELHSTLVIGESVFGALEPGLRKDATVHAGYDVRGLGQQNVYSFGVNKSGVVAEE